MQVHFRLDKKESSTIAGLTSNFPRPERVDDPLFQDDEMRSAFRIYWHALLPHRGPEILKMLLDIDHEQVRNRFEKPFSKPYPANCGDLCMAVRLAAFDGNPASLDMLKMLLAKPERATWSILGGREHLWSIFFPTKKMIGGPHFWKILGIL